MAVTRACLIFTSATGLTKISPNTCHLFITCARLRFTLICLLSNSNFSFQPHFYILQNKKHVTKINLYQTLTFFRFGEDVRIIHFIGETKPWLQYFDTLTGIVRPPPNNAHLQPLLQMWWNIFCDNVYTQLSSSMVNICLKVLDAISFFLVFPKETFETIVQKFDVEMCKTVTNAFII